MAILIVPRSGASSSMGTATSPHWIVPQVRQLTLVFGRFAAWPESLDELDSVRHPLAISTNPTNHPHRSMARAYHGRAQPANARREIGLRRPRRESPRHG